DRSRVVGENRVAVALGLIAVAALHRILAHAPPLSIDRARHAFIGIAAAALVAGSGRRHERPLEPALVLVVAPHRTRQAAGQVGISPLQVGGSLVRRAHSVALFVDEDARVARSAGADRETAQAGAFDEVDAVEVAHDRRCVVLHPARGFAVGIEHIAKQVQHHAEDLEPVAIASRVAGATQERGLAVLRRHHQGRPDRRARRMVA
ncbi:hypothetical protein CATMIT_01772, partial [Catenibacterium mitsuokai DSM 15897]